MKEYSWHIVIGVLAMIIGIIVGICWQSNLIIEIDNKIRYSELLNWVTTIIIGIWVGYVLKNKFENSKVVKNYLLDDIKGILIDVDALKKYCYSFKAQNTFNENERKDIIAKLNIIDKKIHVFSEFLLLCYEDKHKTVSEPLVKSSIAFNKRITGDELYGEAIGNTYFDNIMTEGAAFETSLRKINLVIIKEL